MYEYAILVCFSLVQHTLMVLTSWTNIKWEVRGREYMENDEPAVGVINHQSSLDMQGIGYVSMYNVFKLSGFWYA